MIATIGKFNVRDSLSLIVHTNEAVQVRPFNGQPIVNIMFMDDISDPLSRWQIQLTPPDIVNLTLYNHNSDDGASTINDIQLGNIGNVPIFLRYSYNAYGDLGSYTRILHLNFGVNL